MKTLETLAVLHDALDDTFYVIEAASKNPVFGNRMSKEEAEHIVGLNNALLFLVSDAALEVKDVKEIAESALNGSLGI